MQYISPNLLFKRADPRGSQTDLSQRCALTIETRTLLAFDLLSQMSAIQNRLLLAKTRTLSMSICR